MSLTIDMPLFEPTFRIADKEVTAYSEAELAQFKEAFATQEKHRPRMLVLIFLAGYPLVALSGALVITAVTRLCKDPGAEGFGVVAAVAAMLLPAWWLQRRLQRKCTACRHDVDHSAGPFCPCCGKRTLSHYGKHPTCADCGTVLKWDQWTRQHSRQFSLRWCAVCGVKLSDRGV